MVQEEVVGATEVSTTKVDSHEILTSEIGKPRKACDHDWVTWASGGVGGVGGGGCRRCCWTRSGRGRIAVDVLVPVLASFRRTMVEV